MNEFFNWNDTLILWKYHWFWLLLAAAIGVWIGWRTSGPAGDNN